VFQRCSDKQPGDKPGYGMAWNALYQIARNYQQFKETGSLTEAQADAEIKAAYEQLLEKYPACKAARVAHRWLCQRDPAYAQPGNLHKQVPEKYRAFTAKIPPRREVMPLDQKRSLPDESEIPFPLPNP
jgi:hypothetical protein